MNKRLGVLLVGLAGVGAAATMRHRVGEFGLDASLIRVGGREAQPEAEPEGFRVVRRRGSVDLDGEYDLSGLTIPKDEIHTLLPRDAIPALTDPEREPAAEAAWLPDEGRVIVVRVGDEVLGVPLRVLDWHEVVNTTVGGEPVAATYCPLCDSATVFSRRVSIGGPGEGNEADSVILEFGVSGALYNSNVLMYDRRDRGLWSQLGMDAVSGPLAGATLDVFPVEIVSFQAFKREHPDAAIVSNRTGHDRDYSASPYEAYFQNDGLMVPVRAIGDALPRKTLGIGVATDEGAWFIPQSMCVDGYALETPMGPVRVAAREGGLVVEEAPAGVRTAQTFYYAWSAFYPETHIAGP